jgi:hypothetical protein
LQVFGTVTKNPVATGADLVAYSGFSRWEQALVQGQKELRRIPLVQAHLDLRFTPMVFNLVVELTAGLLISHSPIPRALQIAKIIRLDEKVLFQENAQATLYGSSDAVTALAYDDTTELLHVGTSEGRSVLPRATQSRQHN